MNCTGTELMNVVVCTCCPLFSVKGHILHPRRLGILRRQTYIPDCPLRVMLLYRRLYLFRRMQVANHIENIVDLLSMSTVAARRKQSAL